MIPITLKDTVNEGKLQPGDFAVLEGFGVLQCHSRFRVRRHLSFSVEYLNPDELGLGLAESATVKGIQQHLRWQHHFKKYPRRATVWVTEPGTARVYNA